MAESGNSRIFLKALPGVLLSLCILLMIMAVVFPILSPVRASGTADNTHLGVASCAGSTCHGRLEADGTVVRQDEVLRWQEPSSPAGKHSQAYSALLGQRSAQIARNLGIGKASSAPMCLGCHADPAASRGARSRSGDEHRAGRVGTEGLIAPSALVFRTRPPARRGPPRRRSRPGGPATRR